MLTLLRLKQRISDFFFHFYQWIKERNRAPYKRSPNILPWQILDQYDIIFPNQIEMQQTLRKCLCLSGLGVVGDPAVPNSKEARHVCAHLWMGLRRGHLDSDNFREIKSEAPLLLRQLSGGFEDHKNLDWETICKMDPKKFTGEVMLQGLAIGLPERLEKIYNEKIVHGVHKWQGWLYGDKSYW